MEYAIEAVKRGSSVVCLQGKNMVVLGIERRATAKLQDPRTIRKIVKLGTYVRVCDILIVPYNVEQREGTIFVLVVTHLVSIQSPSPPSPDDHVTLAFAGLTADARVSDK